MAIGKELLDVPFAEMVRNLAFAIAEGQLALDRSSIETLQFLIENEVDIVPEVTEIIEPVDRSVEVNGQQVPITGASIRASGAQPVRLNLLQAGLQPTFYQFTEASLEVKISISIKRTEEGDESPQGSNVPVKRLATTKAFVSPVNYRTANTYSYSAEGSSVLRATLRPVPPPPRLTPRIITVNALNNPPTVTINE
jgi:hypothetical protein